ncbi:conserved exported hypothetical protein [Desulfamplus magnetovallimortis]|uniref:Uncharacterized protein n=1 Tax=Desulfamplus magnetovallimortis TaxID=1246637 RepID=A0A1W1HFZ3_9BACT|nr:hypothetical protein [Desulfamplus magnetovallimortis]SLM31356.1 conserved exported hypothetical protein [Desulfamplus magnetovallimortis]
MINFKLLYFMILVFLHFLLPLLTFAVETAPRISDREITEKLARLEAGQDALRSEMKSSNEALSSRISDLRDEMKSSNEALSSRMSDLRDEMKSSNEALRSEMKSINEALRSEMKSSNEALRSEMKLSNEALNSRLDDSYNTMLVFFGSIVTLIVALFAYIAWDRRTMVKPLSDQLNLLEREVHDDLDLDHSDGSLLRRQLQALRQFAGKNPEFAEIMRGLALL